MKYVLTVWLSPLPKSNLKKPSVDYIIIKLYICQANDSASFATNISQIYHNDVASIEILFSRLLYVQSKMAFQEVVSSHSNKNGFSVWVIMELPLQVTMHKVVGRVKCNNCISRYIGRSIDFWIGSVHFHVTTIIRDINFGYNSLLHSWHAF